MTNQDREKKIAEVLDLSKPVSDCPECGGLGEIGQFGSRRKCECLYVRLKFLKSELEREREENRKLREERDEWGRTAQEAINTVFVREHQLQSAQQDKEKLIEGLRMATDLLGTVPMNDARLWGVYNKLCDTLKSVGVEVDASETPNQR